MNLTFPTFTERQVEFVEATKTHRYSLYGGAGGGGKSFALRWWLVYFLISAFKSLGIKGMTVGLFCEDYPALQNRQITKIQAEFPRELGEWNGSLRQFRMAPDAGGGVISCLNLDDPGKYRSAEFAAIAIDELTLNPRSVFDSLIWRLRWPGFDDVKFVAGTNPTGTGHGWVRKLWVDRDFRGEPAALKPSEFVYVPAKASDNPHLPPSYFTETLASLPEFMRKALMEGSWDVIEGQFFTEWSPDLHVKPPRPEMQGVTDRWGIPHSWARVGGIDWGRAAPWAALEAAIDPEGRVIVYRGVAEAGWDHERQVRWLLDGSPNVTWYADRSCWARSSANSKEARALDMSHYELWLKYGGRNIMPAVGGDRVAGWNHVSAFLKKMPKVKDDEPTRAWIEFLDVPGLRGDHGIITTLPKLIHDPNRPEDVDTCGDDHSADSLSYLLRARPTPKRIVPDKNPFKEGDYFSARREKSLVEIAQEGITTVNAPQGALVGGW